MFVYTKKDTTPCCENNVINPKARKMLYDDEKSGESVKSARRRGGKDKICASGWANQTPCLQINGHQQAKRAFVKVNIFRLRSGLKKKVFSVDF